MFLNEEQRTDAWKLERAGKFTGSRFDDVLARNVKTGKPLKCYDDLIWQMVVERMTQQAVEGPSGYALQWGTDVEPFGIEAYELETGNTIMPSGFIQHPDYSFIGASPDGLIGTDGGFELKCPKSSAVHLERFLLGMPDEYRAQVQGCMFVTGRKWWDFCSYDPRMPESHRLFITRIERDDLYIKRLETALIEAESLVQSKLSEIMQAAA